MGTNRIHFRRLSFAEGQTVLRAAMADMKAPAPGRIWRGWTRAIGNEGPEAFAWCPECGRIVVIPAHRIASTGSVKDGKVVCPWAGCDARYAAFLDAWDPTSPLPAPFPGARTVTVTTDRYAPLAPPQ